MFHPHSLLWHYLWVAPHLIMAVLAAILWSRGLEKELRRFFVYACFQVTQWAILYPMDLIPSVSAVNWWRVCWASLLVESIIVFVLISDIFAEAFGSYAALARLGKILIRGGGVVLLIGATAVAALTREENQLWLIPASHMVHEAMHAVVSGLILLLFASAAYFRLVWKRWTFGIALGLGVNACIHLATWALMANAVLPDPQRVAFDFLNMGAFHIAVLVWFYYLIVPHRVAAESVVALPENNLAAWNRELERLLQQ